MAMIKIDGVSIPNPQDLTVNYQTLETVQQSEAGTDLITVLRPQKRTITFTARCNSKMFYDYIDSNGQFYFGAGLKAVVFPNDISAVLARVRVRSAKMVNQSEDADHYSVVKGLWEVGIEIIEV